MKQVRWVFAAAIAVATASAPLSAQEPAVVSGRVTNAAGAAENAVLVRINSLNVGTTTSADGTYRLVIPAARIRTGQQVTITASRVGLASTSRTVTLSAGATLTQNFQLGSQALGIEGIVVTALGVQRERSQLGTAQQQINTEDLNVTRTPSVVNQLQGKVAGVQITGGGTQGGSNNVVIRGSNSIAGNNQPLFVVDGIPVSNRGRGGSIGSGYDYGNAISDINPEDIATLTVLKGPNAAAIYGSRAANGAIVITTKSGAAAGNRIRTEFSTNLTTERPSILPDFQNRYGQGAGGAYAQTADQSWGPELDVGNTACQYNSTRNGTTCVPTPLVSHPNNVRDFFEDGVSSQNTLAFSGGTDRANARLSLGYDNIDGYIPENTFQKYTATLNGAMAVSDRLRVTGNIQYLRNQAKNRPGQGYNQSILEQFFWFGRQVDINDLRDYNRTGGVGQPANREFNWNYNYHNNPFWIQEQNEIRDRRDRVIGQGSATFTLTDGVNATLRSGSDLYTFNADQQYAPRYLNVVNPTYNGGYTFIDDFSNENNTELLVTADRNVSRAISINALAGGGLRREYFRTNSQTTNGITVAGVYTPTNAAVSPTLGQSITRRSVNSVFGSLSATFNDWFTLEGTARNDWSSTLPAGENSYFYPSLSASAVLSDAIPMLRDNSVLSYFKVRGSIAEVGNDADPYRLRTYFSGVAQQFNGQPQYSQGDVLANASLKPELTRSTEFGAEFELFEGRVSFDASVYNKRTRNQIFDVPISGASGFLSQSINAGLVTNKGFEALVGVTPVDRGNFRWTSTFNYGRNRSEVASLFPGTESVVLGSGLFGEAQLEARVGKPLGAIYGAKFARDEEGNILTSGGIPYTTGEFEYLGGIQPDWTGGWNNEFSYRAVQLGVLFDIRQGGNIMSYTNLVGTYSGVLQESLRGRELSFDEPGVLFNGIDEDTGAPNTEHVNSELFFQSIFGIAEPYVYEGSFVKLRELRFGFDLPGRYAQRLGARSINVAITGRNLYTWADIPNIDPEFAYSSGNFQGFEYGILSNPRSIGVSFRVRP